MSRWFGIYITDCYVKGIYMRLKFQFLGRTNDIPLKYKFLIIYIMCVLIPILTINIIFLDRISRSVKERETENLNISMDRAISDMNNIINNCISVSNSISIDSDLDLILDKDFENTGDFYDSFFNVLKTRLNRYMPVFTNILQLRIYTDNNTIESGGNYYYISNDIQKTEWYREISTTKDKLLLYSYWGKEDENISKPLQHITLIKKLSSYAATNKYRKILKIDIDTSKLYDIFNREQKYLSFFMVDKLGRIVCSTNQKYENNHKLGFTKFDHVSISKNTVRLERSMGQADYLKGWKLVGIADQKRIFDALKQSRYFIFSLTFISMLISSILILIMAQSYNFRVGKLSRHMEKVKNQQFDLIQLNEGKDEIGGLIRSFNLMTAKINSLINDVYKLEIQKKDLEIERVRAELNFLQSQMNPHFLFNTLNAMMAVSVKNNYTEVVDIIKYLAKIMRRLINWKDDMITVQEEISFTEMYLKIEKFRFCEKFEYSIIIDDKALECKIPKMSIQSLVENSCKHGIQAIKDTGIVKVNVDKTEDALIISVEDNGSGIKNDRLNEILTSISEKGDLNGSVGIRNVYKRLQLYFGNNMDFTIHSHVNHGTKVILTIKDPKDK